MTRKPRDYRVRIATQGATSVSGNVDLTIDTVGSETDGWLADRGLTRWGGQRIKPLRGQADSVAWTVRIGESQAGEQFVRHIGDSEGRPALLRRLIDVSRSADQGSTWTVQTTARIHDVSMVQPGVWELRCIDERLSERETEIFSTSTTTSVYPMGPREPWHTAWVAPPLAYKVTSVAQSTVRLGEPFRLEPGYQLEIPSFVQDAIVEDAVDDEDPDENTIGGFKTLRVDVFDEGADFSDLSNRRDVEFQGTNVTFDTTQENVKNGLIANSTNIVTPDGVGVAADDESRSRRERRISKIDLLWDTNQPSVGDILQIRLWFNGRKTSRANPKHVGGTGTHAMQIAKDLYNDHNIRIDAAAFDTLIADKEIPDLTLRITEPHRMDRWLERNIYQPYGIIPFIDADGRVSPKRIYQTSADEISDVTTLTNLTSSVLVDAPQWRNATQDHVTRLAFNYETIEDYTDTGKGDNSGIGGDGIRTDTETEERDYRTDTYGTWTTELSLTGVHESGRASHIADGMSRRIFNRYGDGAIRSESIPALSSADSVDVGDYVVVDTRAYPNVETGSYADARLLQVIGRHHTREPGMGAVVLDLLDAGPELQPLNKPTLSANPTTNKAIHSIDVTVSDLPDGAGYLLQVAKNATEPAADSSLWGDVGVGSGEETVSVGGLESGSTYWFRARATKEGRLSSLWSDAVSASTTALTAPSGLSFANTSGCSFDVSWTVGESDRATRIEVDGGNVDFDTRLEPGTTKFAVHDGRMPIQTSTTYTVTVTHLDRFGGGASVSGSVTTTATADTGPDPLGISVLVGDDIQ